jgi:hypothetical protein
MNTNRQISYTLLGKITLLSSIEKFLFFSLCLFTQNAIFLKRSTTVYVALPKNKVQKYTNPQYFCELYVPKIYMLNFQAEISR